MSNYLNDAKNIQASWDKIVRLLKGLEKHEKDGYPDPFSAAKDLKEIELASLMASNISKTINGIKEEVDKANEVIIKIKSSIAQDFANQLDPLLKLNNCSLGGRLPKLKYQFYEIIIEDELGRATIYYGEGQEKLIQLPLDAEKVAKYIQNIKIGSEMKKEVFLEKLKIAYERAKKTNENKAAICDVLVEMNYLLQPASFRLDPRKESFVEYRRVDFSYDLFRYRAANVIELGVATYAFTKNRKDFLWIPDGSGIEGRPYSHVNLIRSVD